MDRTNYVDITKRVPYSTKTNIESFDSTLVTNPHIKIKIDEKMDLIIIN
ncbi:MAG: hypothetical protein Ta2D_06930 [Rickettsiales bacterium]|nr:MAG: hypothetical protein Ta2D_06930 [Rickettsiales bacterium]